MYLARLRFLLSAPRSSVHVQFFYPACTGVRMPNFQALGPFFPRGIYRASHPLDSQAVCASPLQGMECPVRLPHFNTGAGLGHGAVVVIVVIVVMMPLWM